MPSSSLHQPRESWGLSFRRRVYLYAIVGVVLYGLGVALTVGKGVVKGLPFTFIVADARSYYMYLPSLVIDRDLDFTNQIVEHWGCGDCPPALDIRTPRGYVQNKYPTGLAQTLLPSFLLAHVASLAAYAITGSSVFTPDGYSILYQLINFAWIAALGIATMALVDRVATTVYGVSPRTICLAVLLYWSGSSYLYYFAREPYMVHIASTFWIALILWSACSVGERLRAGKSITGLLAMQTFALSMALVCRPTNVFVLGVVVVAIMAVARSRTLAQCGRQVSAGLLLAMLLLAIMPIAGQVAVWYRMSGNLVHYSYGQEGFRWTSPALWQTLLSSNHGLLFWSPLLCLALLGWAVHVRRDGLRTPMSRALVAGFVLLWYLNSAWWCWWFGGSFGGRSFIEATPFLVLGLAFALDWAAERRPTTRAVVYGFAGASVVYSWVLMLLYISSRIPRDSYLF